MNKKNVLTIHNDPSLPPGAYGHGRMVCKNALAKAQDPEIDQHLDEAQARRSMLAGDKLYTIDLVTGTVKEIT